MLNSNIEKILKLLNKRLSKLEVSAGSSVDTTTKQSEEEEDIPLIPRRDDFKQPKEGTVPTIRQPKKYNIPDRLVQKIMNYNDMYWSAILGKQVHFQITKVDLSYMTTNDVALYRNCLLTKFFMDPPVVVDAYAGIGMDTISFMYNLYQKGDQNVKKIYAVENNDEKGRIERLAHNVHQYFDAMNPRIGDSEPVEEYRDPKFTFESSDFINLRKKTPSDTVEYHVTGTELFFKIFQKDYTKKPGDYDIDLLYIDPPWTLPAPYKNSGAKGEATPGELIQFLYDTVFEHLIEKQIHVRVVCIKTRFDWNNCEPFLDILRSHISEPEEMYHHEISIENKPFKNTFYFHVIKTRKALNVKYKRSKLFKKVYHESNGDGTYSKADVYEIPEDKDADIGKWRPSKQRKTFTTRSFKRNMNI